MSKKDKSAKDKAKAKAKGVKGKFAEKLDMYDMIIANLIAGRSIIEPSQKLDNSQIAIGFSNIASETQISKYFLIKEFPDYLRENMFDVIRDRCVKDGIKINFYMYSQPHRINWESAEMKNKISIWKKYAAEISNNVNVFEYRGKRDEVIARDRIVTSTQYLNEAELDFKRSTCKVAFLIEVTAHRDEQSILNMTYAIRDMKTTCGQSGIRIKELSVNMIDWLQYFGLFSLKGTKEVATKVSKKILTDDILCIMNGYKQGRVGVTGMPLGIDILSGLPVLYLVKADPDAAENWLISASTGGGKSWQVKVWLLFLLAMGIVVTVMDYEGDEYNYLACYLRAYNKDDVKIISMGKGSTVYFDPMEIAELTGDPEIDCDLKENAVSSTFGIFRTIITGVGNTFDTIYERVLSMAIKRVYDSAGVTDARDTWHRSKGIRVGMVYDEIKEMVESKELVDHDNNNVKHRAAMNIADAAAVYFEPGEAKSGTFKNPMSANELFKAQLVIFSFGMKGSTSSEIDPVLLALKQISVANVSIQISNHCKYVKHCFNAKVWEEYQRWGEAQGSAEIIGNAMTGGRKRGDINYIITNDLAAMLDDDNPINKKLRQNIQNYAIGKINDSGVRAEFCKRFSLEEIRPALDRIAMANVSDDKQSGTASAVGDNKYKHAFCVVLESGKKAIIKTDLPEAMKKSQLLRTGVLKDEDTVQ